MATGPEHYQKAERLLAMAESERFRFLRTFMALTHALCANAAATALAGEPSTDKQAWRDVAGVK